MIILEYYEYIYNCIAVVIKETIFLKTSRIYQFKMNKLNFYGECEK